MRRKVRSVFPLLVLGAVGLLFVAGCGGGGSSSQGSSSGGGGSSFADGANAACTSANKQIAALGTPQQEEVLGYLQSTERIIEKLHKEVAALDASGAAETEYTEALAKSVPILTEMTNAARNENFDAVREISDELIAFHLGELAEKAELTACAEVPEAES